MLSPRHPLITAILLSDAGLWRALEFQDTFVIAVPRQLRKRHQPLNVELMPQTSSSLQNCQNSASDERSMRRIRRQLAIPLLINSIRYHPMTPSLFFPLCSSPLSSGHPNSSSSSSPECLPLLSPLSYPEELLPELSFHDCLDDERPRSADLHWGCD